MFYTNEELSLLTRKELQKLCKQFGVKANKKNVDLVEDLCEYFNSLRKEEKVLEDDLKNTSSSENIKSESRHDATFEITEEQPNVNTAKKWISDDDSECGCDGSDLNNQFRDELMEEVEKRAQEKLTKIPRFRVDNVYVPGQDMPPGAAFKSKHSQEFRKLDSLDVYMEKKRKRAEIHFACQKKIKTAAVRSLNKLKSANEPVNDATIKKNIVTYKNTTDRSQVPIKRHSFKKLTNKTGDAENSNFLSKLKSPQSIIARTSPRLNALQEKNTKVMKPAFVQTPSLSRKSVKFTNISNQSRKSNTSKFNKSLGDIRSPNVTNTASMSSKKTPIKFDLQESLKKSLTYKPHTGKLKEVYFADRRSLGAVPRGGEGDRSFNKTLDKSLSSSTANQKISVKEITKKVSTRSKRRVETSQRRDNKRHDALNRRRGIVS